MKVQEQKNGKKKCQIYLKNLVFFEEVFWSNKSESGFVEKELNYICWKGTELYLSELYLKPKKHDNIFYYNFCNFNVDFWE